MGLVDTAMVGRVSPVALASAGMGGSITITLCYFGLGVMLAFDPLMSQAVGAKEFGVARSHYWQGVWLALLIGVALMVPVFATAHALGLVGVQGEVASGVETFVHFRLVSIPGVLLFGVARSYLQGIGRTRAILWSMVAANVANFLLDLVLVFGWGPIPPLGVAGAAIATSVCTYLQFGLLLLDFGGAPQGHIRRVDWSAQLRCFKLGYPIGLQYLAESGIFTLIGVLAGRIGTKSVAAHQIAMNWGSLSFCVAVGIGSAASTRVGWAIGAGDMAAARRSGMVAFGSVTAFMGMMALLFIAIPQGLVRVMSSDAAVVAQAQPLLFVVGVFQLSDGLQAAGAGALRGAGDMAYASWINLLGHWMVGLPVALGLGVFGTKGVEGLWWGLSAGLTVVAVALVDRFERLSRKEIGRLKVG